MMSRIADLIIEWLSMSSTRNASMLSRITGVPRQTISNILGGREPTIEVAARLAKVLPRGKVLLIICESHPEFCVLISGKQSTYVFEDVEYFAV